MSIRRVAAVGRAKTAASMRRVAAVLRVDVARSPRRVAVKRAKSAANTHPTGAVQKGRNAASRHQRGVVRKEPSAVPKGVVLQATSVASFHRAAAVPMESRAALPYRRMAVAAARVKSAAPKVA